MAITPLPTPPSRSAPATFAERTDDFLSALPTFATEANALAVEVENNAGAAAGSATAASGSASDAAGQAVIATAQADAAFASVAVSEWISGTLYAKGENTWSPADLKTYRRKVAGAGSTDPSLDSTNWELISATLPAVYRSARTSNTILGVSDRQSFVDIISGTFTQIFNDAATLGSGWFCYIRNSGPGVITLAPNGAETINGAATLILYPGHSCLVATDGSNLYTPIKHTPVGLHKIRLTGGNGYGSTATKIRRYTTVVTQTGTAMTYADSATAGMSVTINEPGLYAISRIDGPYNLPMGLSVNSSQLTTDIHNISSANILLWNYAEVFRAVSFTTSLSAGDVVRAHDAYAFTATTQAVFEIIKVGAI